MRTARDGAGSLGRAVIPARPVGVQRAPRLQGRGMFRLLRERPGDSWEVENLLDLAFAPGRMALSSYKLRDRVRPVSRLCTIARDEYDTVVGAIRVWPVQVGTERLPSVLVGPVAVHPTRQGEGLGALLMLEMLESAAGAGWMHAILVGDEPYYRRFGFTRNAGKDLQFPPPTSPERVLARAFPKGNGVDLAGEVQRWQGEPYEIHD